MNFKKILLSASILLGGLCANAQETVTEYTFFPHWYGQAQVGIQETIGEGPFGRLLSPNVQLAAGYKFNPYIGMRLNVNAWQSKACMDQYKWKWNYVAPAVDAVVDLTNVFGGFNPNRLVEVNLLAGIGLNIGFHNNEANDIAKAYQGLPAGESCLGNLWDGTKARFLMQFGCDINFNVAENWQVGLELMANNVNDNYNSKVGSNLDWYVNALVGVKYFFGPQSETVTRVIEPPVVEPQIIERVVEKIVEVPAQPAPEKKEAEVMRRDIFFKINTTAITGDELTKVAAIADFLKSHPGSKVTITGYADKGTGSLQLNLRLAAKRAEAVAQVLRTQYGISNDRMVVKSMGEAEHQPYPDPVQNRVAIAIAQEN
ncbi:MAG: OmpA family protein [Bacteroides sp.]|nr:OmpA family protein [Bacteroides sp.]